MDHKSNRSLEKHYKRVYFKFDHVVFSNADQFCTFCIAFDRHFSSIVHLLLLVGLRNKGWEVLRHKNTTGEKVIHSVCETASKPNDVFTKADVIYTLKGSEVHLYVDSTPVLGFG